MSAIGGLRRKVERFGCPCPVPRAIAWVLRGHGARSRRGEWVVATQEPPGCDGYGRACAVVGNEIGGNLEACADRRGASGGEGAAVLPGDVVHHGTGHGVELGAALGI